MDLDSMTHDQLLQVWASLYEENKGHWPPSEDWVYPKRNKANARREIALQLRVREMIESAGPDGEVSLPRLSKLFSDMGL